MVTIKIQYRGHSWCIILIHWGVANIAAYPNNQNNCSDGYYWDTSTQEPGKPDNGLARCAKCSELCEFQQDLEILMTNSKCHIVKPCQALLNNTFIGTCESGYIFDVVNQTCVPCEYSCEYGFIQNGMQNICHVVCSVLVKIDNGTIVVNETIHSLNNAKLWIIFYIFGVTIVSGTVIIMGVTLPICLCIMYKQKQNSNSSQCDLYNKTMSNLPETRINVHESESLIGSETHNNITSYDKQPQLDSSRKSKSVDASEKTQRNQSHLQSSADTRGQTTSPKCDLVLANNDFKMVSGCDEKSTTHNNTSTDTSHLSKSAKSSSDKIYKTLITQNNKPDVIDNGEISLSYNSPRASVYSTFVSETPISIDIFGNDYLNLPTKNEDELMFSYTSATPIPLQKPTPTPPSEYSFTSDVTSIEFNNHADASMAGMSLYSYIQPGSVMSYVPYDNYIQPSSVYSFKETVYNEDDFKNQIDKNDKNAPHIKGAEEHGNLTAAEIEQLPKDLSDIPDVQTKLQYLAQKQYVKRIISNGRYIRAWYDALDQINANRLIGQVLEVSKRHYNCEYVYNHKA